MNPNEQQPQSDHLSVAVHPLLLQPQVPSQPVLFVSVHADDEALLRHEDLVWLQVIRCLDWKRYRHVAALYYQALWEFNQAAAAEREARLAAGQPVADPEEEGQATLRLLYERPTEANPEAQMLHPTPEPPARTLMVCEEALEPGVVPYRLCGREPKDFFAMFMAFEAVHLMGKAGTAEEVYHHLTISPPMARACGFTIPDPTLKEYRRTDIPRLRKLEQFEQIMSARGLWAEARKQTIQDNLQDGVIPLTDRVLVHDTTHFPANSAMEVVQVPEMPTGSPESVAEPVEAGATAPARTQSEEARLEKRKSRQRKTARHRRARRKSQSRTVKNCRCPDRKNCPHSWELSDPGAGTVVKGSQQGHKRMNWAHKAAILALSSGIPLDAVAMTDAASHDSRSLLPHLKRLFELYPGLEYKFGKVLADSAYDDEQLKEDTARELGLLLETHLNPRGRKSLTSDLGRGMQSLSPTGVLTCQAEQQMSYRGVRWDTEKFLYGPPMVQVGTTGVPACKKCPLRDTCCRAGVDGGRHVAIPFEKLPHIDPEDPPMTRRFKVLMSRRPAVERAIKRIKIDLGDPQLVRRGNDAFQGHLDRSLIAFHLLLRFGR